MCDCCLPSKYAAFLALLSFSFFLCRRWLKRCDDRLQSISSCSSCVLRSVPTSSNTSFSLYWVSAEHSTYLTAPSSRAIRSPSSRFTGAIRCLDSLSLTALSSRRSTWVPTIRQGTPGQWWCTSGNHFSRTFSNEAGDVTEKQTKNTSVCGYDSGRSRS